MNEVEAQQAERLQWSVDGESDYDSDASLSVSDDSEGEVPNVIGEADTPSKLLATGKPHSGQNIVSGYPPKHSTIANPGLKELGGAGGAFIRGWKPVIDGKIHISGGENAAAAHKVRSSSMQQAVAPSGAAAATATNVSQKHSSSDNASPSPAGTGASEPKVDGNESDSDVRRVPEMSTKGGGASGATSAQPQGQSSGTRSRKRGVPADKEHKRLKRLLRNRVSAQQARERKKAYLSDLEVKSKELQNRNEELEDKVFKLERENMMLRQIVKNTTSKKPGGGGVGD